MKPKIIISYVVVALLFGSIGFFLGVRAAEEFEETLRAQFSDDVVEVRQGRLAGWAIHSTENATLAEEWKDFCTDVIRYAGEQISAR